MAVNEFETKDYTEEAHELITEQFRDKPVFKKYLELLLNPSEELQVVLKDLMQKRSIDTAEGVQLDMIGAIVGQRRTLLDADLLGYFGFIGDLQAGSYGTISVPELGSVWRSRDSPMTGNITLNDDLYRVLIKAKIVKNVTRATPEDIMRFANFMFNTSGSTIIFEGGAKFKILIGKVLTRSELGLLRYINRDASYSSRLFPKPVGVGFEVGSFNYDAFFAFKGIPNAKGYGGMGYTHYFDGSFIGDGSALPNTKTILDEYGNVAGGYWATWYGAI